MTLLMKKLNLEIPPFKLQRILKVDLEELKDGKEKVTAQGIDRNGGIYDLFNSLKVNGSAKNSVILDKNAGDNVVINLAFQGHYNENDLEISVSRKMLRENLNSVRIIMSGDTFAVKNGK